MMVPAIRRARRQNAGIRAVVDRPAIKSDEAPNWRYRRRLLWVWQLVVIVIVVANTAILYFGTLSPVVSIGVVIPLIWAGREVLEYTRRRILARSRTGRHAEALEAHAQPWVFFIAGFETAQVHFNADQPEQAFEVLRIATPETALETGSGPRSTCT